MSSKHERTNRFVRSIIFTVIVGFVAFFVAYWAMAGLQNLNGSAYERRAHGAEGICDVTSWNTYEGTSSKVYTCADEQQRQAAADVVAQSDEVARGVAGAAVGFAVVALCFIRIVHVNRPDGSDVLSAGHVLHVSRC